MTERKRRTVTVTCGIQNGLHLRIHSPAAHQHAPRLPNGDPGVTLSKGLNPGIDKEWFEEWLKENERSSYVEAGLVTATDEKDPDEPATDEPVA